MINKSYLGKNTKLSPQYSLGIRLTFLCKKKKKSLKN